MSDSDTYMKLLNLIGDLTRMALVIMMIWMFVKCFQKAVPEFVDGIKIEQND